MKTCSRCGVAKPKESSFSVAKSYADGYRNICKTCRNQDSKNWKQTATDPRTNKNSFLLRTFGISLDDYTELHKKQNGCCAICGQTENVLHVDHCHKTEIVRGLLCLGCNSGLGMFKENTVALQRAIAYLQEKRPAPTIEQLMNKLGGRK